MTKRDKEAAEERWTKWTRSGLSGQESGRGLKKEICSHSFFLGRVHLSPLLVHHVHLVHFSSAASFNLGVRGIFPRLCGGLISVVNLFLLGFFGVVGFRGVAFSVCCFCSHFLLTHSLKNRCKPSVIVKHALFQHTF